LRILCVGNMLEHICLNITYRPILSTKAPLHNMHNTFFLSPRCKIWTKSYITCPRLCFDFFKMYKKTFETSYICIFFCGCNFMEHISKKQFNKSNCCVSLVIFQIYRSTILSSVHTPLWFLLLCLDPFGSWFFKN
jgi:hypothetical protein